MARRSAEEKPASSSFIRLVTDFVSDYPVFDCEALWEEMGRYEVCQRKKEIPADPLAMVSVLGKQFPRMCEIINLICLSEIVTSRGLSRKPDQMRARLMALCAFNNGGMKSPRARLN